jgi:hypothetical protein
VRVGCEAGFYTRKCGNLTNFVGFEVFTTVTEERVFWDVTLCGSCRN